MKALLEAIRRDLLASPTFDYLKNRVYVSLETSNAVFFPPSFSCPCVLLAPGAFDIQWLPASSTDETKFVQVSTYRYFREIEDALLGNTQQQGILEMNDAVRTFLVHRDLGLSYDEAEVQRVEQPEPFEFSEQEDIVIRQTMTLIYYRYQQ